MKNQKMQIKWNSKISGIYAWENNINGKMYIGKATDIYRRVYEEMNGFRNDKHQNLKKLYNAVKKYGISNFSVIKLLECPKIYLAKIERLLIDYYNTKNKGYNITFGGEGTLGHKVSKNQIEKQKKKLKEYWTLERKTNHSKKMKSWYENKTNDEKEAMRIAGRNWVNDPNIVEKFNKNYAQSLTKDKIEKQKKSLKKYYQSHVHPRAIKTFVVSPNNDVVKIVGISKFCRENFLCESSFKKMLNGTSKNYKGWKKYTFEKSVPIYN